MKKTLVLFAIVFVAFSVKAQRGELAGRVTDEKGEIFTSANVLLLDSLGHSTKRGATADAKGNYSIKDIAPGTYGLQCSFVGYDVQNRKDIVVGADKTTFFDFKLRPSQVHFNDNGGLRGIPK